MLYHAIELSFIASFLNIASTKMANLHFFISCHLHTKKQIIEGTCQIYFSKINHILHIAHHNILRFCDSFVGNNTSNDCLKQQSQLFLNFFLTYWYILSITYNMNSTYQKRWWHYNSALLLHLLLYIQIVWLQISQQIYYDTDLHYAIRKYQHSLVHFNMSFLTHFILQSVSQRF